MSSPKTVGLVLGSGASRGWAHIGAIEALEEADIPIDFIAGCSVGAYIGAIYASGNIDSLKDFLIRMDGRKIFSFQDVVFPRSGLLDGSKRVRQLFSMHSDSETFEELNIPVVMVATDLEHGKKVVLKSGRIVDALRATMSYPGLFSPAYRKGRWLVDGGLVDPVPVGVARAMGAGVVIAVDLTSRIVSRGDAAGQPEITETKVLESPHMSDKGNELVDKMVAIYESYEKNFKNRKEKILDQHTPVPAAPDIIETVMTAIGIMQERITRINLAVDRPDILIQPRLGEMKMMNFDQVQHAMEEGYIAVQEQIEDIRTLLAST